MALQNYVGAIVLEVDGQEVELEDLSVDITTGRKLVKTMNRTGKARGIVQGIRDIRLQATAIIPKSGDLDWASLDVFRVVIYPQEVTGPRRMFVDCILTSYGERYTVDAEAKRSITFEATDEVEA